MLAASLYEVSRRVASTMRCGRVLLAGDAAHQNSPLGGHGHELGDPGRRVAAAVGWPGSSPANGRRCWTSTTNVAVASPWSYVQTDSHANWLVLREPDPDRRAELQADLRAIAADPVRHRERMQRTAMLDAVRDNL